MSFSDIIGQDGAIGYLRGAMERGRVASAYLFVGPHHVGKRSTALTLAKALNCTGVQGDCCDACPSCRKIDEGVHPDVETLSPDGQFIKIDQVRGVANRLALVATEGRARVVIFSRAEQMNLQAANALLKTLEEPPPATVIVLCADQGTRLPETIVSRCVPVRFLPLREEVARRLLTAAGGLEGEGLEFSLRFAQGRLRPGLAARCGNWMTIRDEMIKALEGLHRPIFTQLSREIARWCANEDWRFVLAWLETWFRDLALLAEGIDESALINRDRMGELRACARWFNPERTQRCYRQLLDARDGIHINANKALALETLWMSFKR